MLNMNKMKKQLIKLLNIQAPSGKEKRVVTYVKPILEHLTDKVWTDDYGNLLAEKVVGTGKGATVILSAHMDSVSNIAPDREVIEENGIFRSTKGVLGADDRAGIAIILAVLRHIEKTGFDGKVKVSFSREEEIGCVGASQIDANWIAQSDLAIVVDRRGNNDIVTGTWGQAFCSNEVGKYFEECSAMQDMDWKAVQGGISDATVFSELGVHSVNLSAGYRNEHTEQEYVVFEDMKKTVNLILQALALVNDFVHTFGKVPAINQWNESDSFGRRRSSWFQDEDAFFGSGVLWEGEDVFGEISAEDTGMSIAITQVTSDGRIDEVMFSKEVFEEIVSAYYANMLGKLGAKETKQKLDEDEALPFEEEMLVK
jgi:putative aminopeptidase FrvX